MRSESVQRTIPEGCRAWRLAVALAMACNGFAQVEMPQRGEVIDPLLCRDDPAQSYALYLPSNYTPDRRWPIVYCLDALARGRLPVERFRAAAERHGYIIVGSNNSRNGQWEPIFAAVNAVLADTQQRFSVDRRRLYVAGFSGGARAACAIAASGKIAGAIACSGGFPGSSVPNQVPFAFFGTAGRVDFNLSEMVRVGTELERRQTPHRIIVFEGGHDWAPIAQMEEALAWFDLQAMRRGVIPRDDGWLNEHFRVRTATAAAMNGPADEKASALRAIVADFDGLLDTSRIAAEAAAIEKSRGYRRAVTARELALRDEQNWIDELVSALHEPPEADAEDSSPFPERSSQGAPLAGDREDSTPDLERRSFGSWAPPTSPLLRPERDESFARVRRLAGDLRGRSRKNPAAARALGSVFLTCMTDGEALLNQRKFAPAAHAFEAATILRPDAGWAFFNWAQARAEMGDSGRARELLQAATAKGFNDQAQINQLKSRIDPQPKAPDFPPPILIPELPAVPPGAITVGSGRPNADLECNPVSPEPQQPVESAAAPTTAPDPDVVSLAPVRAAGRALASFGISLRIYSVPRTRQITRVVVEDVSPDSDAAATGVRVGDEITAVDGRSIYSFVATFDRSSDFGRRFVGRKYGDQITLDLLSPSGRERRVKLTEGLMLSDFPW